MSRELCRRRSVYVPETEVERPFVVILHVTALWFHPVGQKLDNDHQVEHLSGDPFYTPETRIIVEMNRFHDSFLHRHARIDTTKDKTQEYITILMTSENSYGGRYGIICVLQPSGEYRNILALQWCQSLTKRPPNAEPTTIMGT